MLPHAPLEPNNNPQQTQFHPTRPPAKEIRGQLHTPQGANPNAARVLLIGAEDTDTHAPRAPSRCLMSETTIFQSAFTKCIMHRRSDNCGRVAALAGGGKRGRRYSMTPRQRARHTCQQLCIKCRRGRGRELPVLCLSV